MLQTPELDRCVCTTGCLHLASVNFHPSPAVFLEMQTHASAQGFALRRKAALKQRRPPPLYSVTTQGHLVLSRAAVAAGQNTLCSLRHMSRPARKTWFNAGTWRTPVIHVFHCQFYDTASRFLSFMISQEHNTRQPVLVWVY